MKGESFQQMMLKKLDIHTQKNRDGMDPYTIYNNIFNSKINEIKNRLNLSVRPKTIKPFDLYRGKKLHDIGIVNDLLNVTSKTQTSEGKIGILDYLKFFKNLLCIEECYEPSEKATHKMEENICELYT